jgi:hypothetical protein
MLVLDRMTVLAALQSVGHLLHRDLSRHVQEPQ